MDLTADLSLLLPLILSGLLCFMSFRQFWRNRTLPPGPTPLPVIGNLLQLRSNPVAAQVNLSKKYGDVFTIYLGSHPVVVVSGYMAVKEIYVDRAEDFLARGDMIAFDHAYKNYGLAFTNDVKRWRELRRFSMTVLRDLGMGKRNTEEQIREEARCLVDELRKKNGSFLDPDKIFMKAVGNIICLIMFGNRHEYEDAEFLGLLKMMCESIILISSRWGQALDMFPSLMEFMPGKHQTIYSHMQMIRDYVVKRVEEKKEILDPTNPRDYVDAFLIKAEKDKENPHSEFNFQNLVCNTMQIFFAGMETTSLTLRYGFLVLMKHPDVLAKVCEEIDGVVGRHRLPKMQDRKQMPFTEAVIHELQRFIDLFPTNLMRKTTRDIEFRGHFIPKNTNVTPLVTTVLKDPTFFSYPNEFNPKNFLDENGEFKPNDAFIIFAAGKRNCLGEALARMEIFLFIVTILQNFALKPEVPSEHLDISPDVAGFGNIPKPYKMSFIPR